METATSILPTTGQEWEALLITLLIVIALVLWTSGNEEN